MENFLPKNTKEIAFGGIFRGEGIVWFDEMKITVDGVSLQNVNPWQALGKIKKMGNEHNDSILVKLCSDEINSLKNVSFMEIPKSIYPDFQNQANIIVARIKANKLLYINSGLSVKDYNWVLQLARVYKQVIELSNPAEKTTLQRDKFMAENLIWLVEQNPEARIVLWAHNAHIEKNTNAQGYFLKETFGEDYLSIGFCGNKGYYSARVPEKGREILSDNPLHTPPKDSYEYVFQQAEIPNFILDLRKADKNKPETSWLWEWRKFRLIGSESSNAQFYTYPNLPEAFDAIIYLDETSASKVFERNME